jgi:hypothetical protein
MKNKLIIPLMALLMTIMGSSILGNVDVYAYSTSTLTSQEISLYSAHPIYASSAKKCAEKATESSQNLYKAYTLWQGNGDAYRHAYWSALMTKETTENFAWKAGLAHEGLEPGYNFDKQNDDTKMDIKNNYSGRMLAQNNLSKSDSDMSTLVKNLCSSGELKRIRKYTSKKGKNDQTIAGTMTNYVGYYVKTTSGGLKKK